MNELLGSKKGFAALVAVGIASYGIDKGWTTEQIAFVLSPLLAYIGAQGFVDARKASKNNEPPKAS